MTEGKSDGLAMGEPVYTQVEKPTSSLRWFQHLVLGATEGIMILSVPVLQQKWDVMKYVHGSDLPAEFLEEWRNITTVIEPA
jgi:hypothetical protein